MDTQIFAILCIVIKWDHSGARKFKMWWRSWELSLLATLSNSSGGVQIVGPDHAFPF